MATTGHHANPCHGPGLTTYQSKAAQAQSVSLCWVNMVKCSGRSQIGRKLELPTRRSTCTHVQSQHRATKRKHYCTTSRRRPTAVNMMSPHVTTHVHLGYMRTALSLAIVLIYPRPFAANDEVYVYSTRRACCTDIDRPLHLVGQECHCQDSSSSAYNMYVQHRPEGENGWNSTSQFSSLKATERTATTASPEDIFRPGKELTL